MKKIIFIAAFAFAFVTAVSAFAGYSYAADDEESGAFDEGAGTEGGGSGGGGDDTTQYKKVTNLDFDEVLLEAELKKPTGVTIIDRQQLKFKNLIQPRPDFEPEMKKSVDNLK